MSSKNRKDVLSGNRNVINVFVVNISSVKNENKINVVNNVLKSNIIFLINKIKMYI